MGDPIAGIARLTNGVSRSISPENPSGAKGQGGRATTGTGAASAAELGVGWKVSPSVGIEPGGTHTLAEIAGPGTVRHLWVTVDPALSRSLVLRMYWEGAARPAVAVPLGDFFGQGWACFAPLNSLPVTVNPHGGLNSYWELPFAESARITLENLHNQPVTVYYQVDYELGPVAEQSGYLHCRWRRSNPVGEPAVHTIVDGVRGQGHYVGTYLAWGSNSAGWWGEGEVKFYLDGDTEWPTICGTGTEDYVGGAWNFDVPGQGYTTYSTAYQGLHQVLRPDGLYRSQQRFGMYRWHLPDPVRFERDLRVTIQALGWRAAKRGYLPLRDDVASTAFWYQRDPAGLDDEPLHIAELEVN